MANESHVVEPSQVASYAFADDGAIPNSSLPLLVYRRVLRFGADDPPAVCERLFALNGWGSTWRNGIYSFPHYHSTAHEVLGIAAGTACVRFGGSGGADLEVEMGDVVLIPAGVGHENLGANRDLLVVGGYEVGASPDLCRGDWGERPGVVENIARVALPSTDPVYGVGGPLVEKWRAGGNPG